MKWSGIKYEDDRGYIATLEMKEYFQQIKNSSYIDCDEVIAEYVYKIVYSN